MEYVLGQVEAKIKEALSSEANASALAARIAKLGNIPLEGRASVPLSEAKVGDACTNCPKVPATLEARLVATEAAVKELQDNQLDEVTGAKISAAMKELQMNH